MIIIRKDRGMPNPAIALARARYNAMKRSDARRPEKSNYHENVIEILGAKNPMFRWGKTKSDGRHFQR